MTDHAPIFNVIIDAKGVTLEKIKPGRPGYAKAGKGLILRQRDAIERFQELKSARGGFRGTHSFQFLDTAKTFAMLCLRVTEHQIRDNRDRVEAYDGSCKSSGR